MQFIVLFSLGKSLQKDLYNNSVILRTFTLISLFTYERDHVILY